MKRLVRPAITAALTILIVLSCTVIAFSVKPPILNNNAVGAALFVQTTPTPTVEEDRSEVGSTDEIVVMGGVIVMIVLIPIILQRKAWTQNEGL